MANDYFQFQQFTVRQENCAMKVGTDGTLLGAWARGGRRILDIGTGTGLIAMMMAQRFPEAMVTGVEIDSDAAQQARQNADASPFGSRITIFTGDITTPAVIESLSHNAPFDAIVSNPPYFTDSLQCPDQQRTTARHTASLTYGSLMHAVAQLLADDGELSFVIPFDSKTRIETEAALSAFIKHRECAVSTTPRKAPRRYLLAYGRHAIDNIERTDAVLETAPGVRSPWYDNLTAAFYLHPSML